MAEHDAIEQLAALLDGDDVADAAPSLGALTGLATAVRDHVDLVAPTPEFRSSLRAELVAAAEAPPGLIEQARTAWKNRTEQLRASARVRVATVTASGMIGSAGVAAAAQQALPGEALYDLKGLTEDARLMLAVDGVAEARLHLAFARERLQELRVTTGQLDTDEVVALLAEMDAHSEAGAEVLLDGVQSGAADADEIRRFTADQRGGLVSVLNDLPLLAKPVAESSLELLRRIEISADGVDPAARSVDEAGLLDDTQQPAARGARSDTPRASDADTPIFLRGEESAIPRADCGCIELPGLSESREHSSTRGHDTADDGTEQAEHEEQEPASEDDPLGSTGGLVDPQADEGGGGEGGEDGEDYLGLDAPTSGRQLPGDETVEAVEDGTDADVSPGVPLEDDADDLLQA